MSYVQTANTPRPAAALAALVIPAGFGALLVAGLAVTAAIAPLDEPIETFDVRPNPQPLPPPTPVPEPSPSTATKAPSQTMPPRETRVPTDFDFEIITGPLAPLDPVGTMGGDIGDGLSLGGNGRELLPPAPSATSSAKPVRAVPRGNPGGWVTDADYRARWIREGLSGTARFTLEVDAAGRVSDCTITQSTGHAALDEATCTLLARRARFDPARNSAGAKTAGSYSSAISWKLPD